MATRRTAGPMEKLIKRYTSRQKNLTAKRDDLIELYERECDAMDRELADIKEVLSRLVDKK